jgi:hypothetical protein
MKEQTFNVDEIEDVKILIKAKGKHFAIVPKGCAEEAKQIRIAAAEVLFSYHFVVSTPLEDLRDETTQPIAQPLIS